VRICAAFGRDVIVIFLEKHTCLCYFSRIENAVMKRSFECRNASPVSYYFVLFYC